MSIGFRKSLFGFNSNDVVEYINKTHKKFAQKEKHFLESIDKLNKSLDEAKAEQEAIRLEKIELDKKINEFNTKNEELEKLYINTQKLNDIALINSQKIIENSENTYKSALEEAEKNLYSIEEVHNSLLELRESILQTSKDFSDEVDKLIKNLNETKEKISINSQNAQTAKEEYEETYLSLVK